MHPGFIQPMQGWIQHLAGSLAVITEYSTDVLLPGLGTYLGSCQLSCNTQVVAKVGTVQGYQESLCPLDDPHELLLTMAGYVLISPMSPIRDLPSLFHLSSLDQPLEKM